MKCPRFLVALLLTAAPLAAQEETPTTSVLVPIVGSVLGANEMRWKTDIVLVNDMSSDIDVALELPTAPDSPAIITTLGPGQTQAFPDVVGEAFGLQQTLSPLLITTSGRRSVTVRATVYGLRGAETTEPQPITLNFGSSWYHYRALDGLSFNDEERTNLGIVNLGQTEANIVLALQRVPGRNVAVTRVTLPPRSNWHLPIQMYFPMIARGTGFTVIMETTARDTHAYASVIANSSSNARFVQPRVATP
jgi:hypothetical protein